jgi:hypothetical protein
MADTGSSPSAATAPAPIISLTSHDETISLVGTPDLAAFVATANARARIKGLADELNPGILDFAKLNALVASLPLQSASVREQLVGHKLVVDSAGLGVLAIEPTQVDAFASSYTLAIERAAGQYILAHATISFDPALARQRSIAAKAAVAAAERAVAAIGQGKADPDGLDAGGARWRRSQAAAGWLLIARAWQSAEPANLEAKEAVITAEKSARRYAMPSGGRL